MVYSVRLVGQRAASAEPNNIMPALTETEESIVTQKTRELCAAIVSHPEFQASQQRIEAFMTNEAARSQYESVVTKGQALQQKQQQAQPLEDAEIAAFEAERDALLKNAVARGFMEAQDRLHSLQHSILKPINKTLELGRVPTAEDLEESCGHGGCGCHDH